jgi:hypothetical protein
MSGAPPQGGANGRQPLRSEEIPAPAAAAPSLTLSVRRDMKLHSILLGGTGFLTKPCVSPQVFHGSMRLAGWAEWPLLPEVWSLPAM